MKIRNINSDYGMDVTFSASTIEDCVFDMAEAIVACGHEFSEGKDRQEIAESLTEGTDYEIVDGDN